MPIRPIKPPQAPSPSEGEDSSTMTQNKSTPPRVRGQSTKNADNKWQAAGSYPIGFARPPMHSRFQKGGKGGPGRPKGSISFDSLMRKQLTQKRNVRVDGQDRKLSVVELMLIQAIKAGAEGNRHARQFLLGEASRLFPGDESRETPSEKVLSESDALSIAEYEAALRRQIEEELRGSARERGDQDR